MDKHNTSIAKTEGNPLFVHKSVRTKVSFRVPFGSTNYPNLQPLYDGIQQELSNLNNEYRRRGTQLIQYGLLITRFQCRIDRLKLLCSQLISDVATYHVSYYKKEHHYKHSIDPTNPPKKNEDLAILAVYILLSFLDLETLAFLDLNRTSCEHIFLGEYNPCDYSKLSTLDKEATDYTIDSMLKYIKVITITYYSQQKDILRKRTAEAAVIAEMEEAKARDAMEAINTSITNAANTFPKNKATLKDAVVQIVDEHNSAAHRRRNPLSQHKRSASGSNDINNRPSKRAKQPQYPNARAKGKAQPGGNTTTGRQQNHTNHKNNTNNNTGRQRQGSNNQNKQRQAPSDSHRIIINHSNGNNNNHRQPRNSGEQRKGPATHGGRAKHSHPRHQRR